MSIDDQPALYLRITVGSGVYTRDDKKLGKVKEVQGRYFKVDAHLRPDYWLSDECVASATPDQSVVLAINSVEVGSYRLKAPQAA